MVSAAGVPFAVVIASRSEPAPESAVVVTTITASGAVCAPASPPRTSEARSATDPARPKVPSRRSLPPVK